MLAMNRIVRPAALALILIICAGSAALIGNAAQAAERANHADTAKILAGMEPSRGSSVGRLTKSRSWRRHAKSFDGAWKSLDRRQLAKIRDWSQKTLESPQNTLLYMFSGPDYLYADTFFPKASTYVLVGLEPVGDEPDIANISSSRLSRGLLHLRSSLKTVLRLSFFMTKEMRVKLRSGGFAGTLPVIYVFLARAGKTIEVVEFLNINADGSLAVRDKSSGGKRASGVKITFSTPGEEDRKTLYYFSTDISNSGLKKSGFLNFLKTLGPADSFVKSASYLMHRSSFSDIRDLILDQSRRIVQDDSGIPIKYFSSSKWDLTPYGRYSRPISLFSSRYQSAMKKLFRSEKRKSIKFGIGYRWRPSDTNVLVAEKIQN